MNHEQNNRQENGGCGEALLIASERVVFKVLVKWSCRGIACWILCIRPRNVSVGRGKTVKTKRLDDS